MTRLGSDLGPALFGLPVQRREVADTHMLMSATPLASRDTAAFAFPRGLADFGF